LPDEHMPQSHLGAQLDNERRRDPGLGQCPGHQQITQMTSIGPVRLGSALLDGVVREVACRLSSCPARDAACRLRSAR
jgi:hypothetical protein